MPQFAFTALDNKDGKRTSGFIEANDREAALRMMAEKDLVVTKLTPVRTRHNKFLSFFGIGGMRIKGEELLVFTQELGSMLDAGIPLKKALDVMINDFSSPVFRQIGIEMSNGLGAGRTLSEMLEEYPDTFSKLYVSMITAGETSGNLPTILLRLASYIEKTENLKKKVKSALFYPMIVFLFALLIMVGIFTFGIPRIKSIYQGLNVELPFLTQMFISIGDVISGYWYLILLVVIAGGFFSIRFFSTSAGQYALDKFKLNVPVFGVLFKRLAISHFSRTMSTLYSSGVPILDAMQIVSGSTGNRVVEKVLLVSLSKMRQGEPISVPLRNSGIFTEMSISMITSGEESGSLDKMLGKLADFYETQVDIMLSGLSGLLEPIIMIFVGGMVGIIILAVALPFLQLGSALK